MGEYLEITPNIDDVLIMLDFTKIDDIGISATCGPPPVNGELLECNELRHTVMKIYFQPNYHAASGVTKR